MTILPVKKGDKNETSAEVQKLLSLNGYDLIIDGNFGSRTEMDVIDFQSHNNLKADGIVGQITYNLLKSKSDIIGNPSLTPLKTQSSINYGDLVVNKSVRQPDAQYIKKETLKTQIFLHFTAGGPSAKNVISGWNSDETTVSTAFVVDRNTGEIFECFDPKFWSFHLGIKNTNGRLDRTSVGIEICSYGPLKKVDNKFYAWPKDWKTEIKESSVFKLDKTFRGYDFFESLTDVQISNVEKLLRILIKTYKIKVQTSFDESWFEFNQNLINNTLPGIWTHTGVRRDKSDLYPDKRILDMLNKLSKEFNK